MLSKRKFEGCNTLTSDHAARRTDWGVVVDHVMGTQREDRLEGVGQRRVGDWM